MARALPALGLFLLLALPSAPTLSAQTVIDLNRPVLAVDDVTYPIASEPARAQRFTRLVLTVPGRGTYVVRTQPFKGAARMGTFRGERLAFEHGRRSIEVQSTTPILRTPGRSADAVYPAYVRYDRFGAVSPFEEADVALSVLDVADSGNVRLSRWGSALEGDLRQHRARIAPMASRIQALHTQRAQLDAEAEAFLYALETYQASRADYLDRYDRLAWMRDRMHTVRERSAYQEDVRLLTEESRRLEAQHARLSQQVARLDRAYSQHQRAIYALSNDSAQMSAEANELADEHLRYVVARDRFNGFDTVMSRRR